MPHAGVHQAERTRGEQTLSERLRCDVAILGQTLRERFRAAQVVKLGTEIRQAVVVGDAVLEAADLDVIGCPMESDFGLRGLAG